MTFQKWTNTSQIEIPGNLLDQVIGQDKAVKIIGLAARQRRFVLLVGQPGTGKSMLAKCMINHSSGNRLKDVLAFPNPESLMNPLIKVVPAGEGSKEFDQIHKIQKDKEVALSFLWWVIFIGVIISGVVLSFVHGGWGYPLGTCLFAFGLLYFKKRFTARNSKVEPRLLVHHSNNGHVNFVDATGLQYGALFGDVRHDPFQSGGRETPPHHLLEAGAIHFAHEGILFIDEASSLSKESQQQLLTVIQEKKYPVIGRSLGSSGSMVRSQMVPCDFILVLAGNEDDVRNLHPALKSRMHGFGYEIKTKNEMEDNAVNRHKMAQFVTQEVVKDGKIPHFSRAAVESVIDHACDMSGKEGHISLRLREVGGIIRASGDVATLDNAEYVQQAHVFEALKIKGYMYKSVC